MTADMTPPSVSHCCVSSRELCGVGTWSFKSSTAPKKRCQKRHVFHLLYKKVKKEEKLKLINKYLKQFELSDMLNKKVYQLSGGEQQRIAIIKLILQGSQIILADEPTSGLDKENELIVMKLLKELNEKGITIIMVTHNMNLCDCFSRVINVENFR